MLVLRSRNEIIQNKHIISSELTNIQKMCFDEDVLHYYIGKNEEHLYWEEFDCLNKKTFEYNLFDKLINVAEDNVITSSSILTKSIVEIFNIINAKEFIMLSYIKRDFFGNRNSGFKPLNDAYKKLEKITGLNSYKEAFVFDLNNIYDIIDVLFWASSYDASFPEYVFLFDQKEDIRISLSHHGYICLREFKKERITDTVLANLGLNVIS